MPRFKAGDRVQLMGDIGRYYKCVIGVVIERSTDETSVLIQYPVRLADGTIANFFDFQLQTPPVVRAHVVFDSSISKKNSGTTAALEPRQICFVATGMEIDLKVFGTCQKSITGQVSLKKIGTGAQITLLLDHQPVATIPTTDRGGFELHGLAAGDITFEVFVPGKRILCCSGGL